MAKILLSSTGFDNMKIAEELLRLVDKSPKEIKVLFDTTASINDIHEYYVNESRNQLIDIGIKKENIIEISLNKEIDCKSLNNIDIIYVCGGNINYLLKKIREKNFDTILKEMLNNGKVYFGVSAGSAILGAKTKYTDGLNIIDVIVHLHYCDTDKELLKRYASQIENKIICLTDNQALRIVSDEYTIIE